MYVSIDQRCTKSGTEAVLRSSLINLNNNKLNVNVSLQFVIPIVPPFLGLSCSNIHLRTHHGSLCVIGQLLIRVSVMLLSCTSGPGGLSWLHSHVAEMPGI